MRSANPGWNGRFPSVKDLLRIGLDKCWRDGAIAKLKSDPDHDGVDAVLASANSCMKSYGVEAIQGGGGPWYEYYLDIRALYVNEGDTYAATLLYDVARGAFYVTSWGDWVEIAERSRRYKFE